MTELVELSTKRITIDRNEFLKVKGGIDTNVYFVENGSLRVFVLDDYEEQIIRFGYKENLHEVLYNPYDDDDEDPF